MFRHHAAVWAAASSILVSGCSDALLSGISSKYRATRMAPANVGIAHAPDPVTVASGEATGPSGSLEVDLELPRTQRGVQALPESTEKVVVCITAAKLSNPVRQTISRSQFVGGKAKMRVEKLPLGEVQVEIKIFDYAGDLVTSGTATSTVKAGLTTPVLLNLIVKEETGGIAIAVDSKTEYADMPVVSIPSDGTPPAIVDDSPQVVLEPIKSRNHVRVGSLSSYDRYNPTRSGTYRDDFALVGAKAGDVVTIDMSADFDAYLQLIDAATGNVLRENDDGGPESDSSITFTVKHGKDYIVRATSYRYFATGAYTLTTTTGQ